MEKQTRETRLHMFQQGQYHAMISKVFSIDYSGLLITLAAADKVVLAYNAVLPIKHGPIDDKDHQQRIKLLLCSLYQSNIENIEKNQLRFPRSLSLSLKLINKKYVGYTTSFLIAL